MNFNCIRLHDGQVGREVGVIDLVEAQTLQGGNHLAGDGSTHGHTEFLAQSGTDSRCGLDDHVLAGLEGLIDFAISDFSISAPVGQTLTHWPH